MYNKLFTKILDSTVWLEADATRLVWITFLAVMDEDGFVALSAVGNVAARARVSIEAAQGAIEALEAPDPLDPSQENEGRRIERVPYGWMVLNAGKYRDIIKRETAREQTRLRVAKYRARNAVVTHSNEKLTPSVSVSVSKKDTVGLKPSACVEFDLFWDSYPRKESKKKAAEAFKKLRFTNGDFSKVLAALEAVKKTEQWQRDEGKYIPHASTWLNQRRFEDEGTSTVKPRVDC